MENEQLNIGGENIISTEQPEKDKAQPRVNRKNKEAVYKSLLRILVSCLVIIIGTYLILFVVAKAANYESIQSMLQHMFGELALMWQRIIA